MQISNTSKLNMDLNRQEYLARAPQLRSYPIKLYVEATQSCNLRCTICGQDRRKLDCDMPMDIFHKVEKELFDHVAEVDFFLTGEPLLAVHFPEMISVCSKYTFLPKVFTNGVYMPDELAHILAREGVFVNVSFDAADHAVFEEIRCGADFKTVCGNILKLKKVQEACGNKRAHIRLASTLGLHNIDQAPKIVEFACKNGIRDVMFGSFDGSSDLTNMLMADQERVKKVMSDTILLADRHKIRFSMFKKVGDFIFERNHNWGDFVLPIDEYAPFDLESFNPYCGDCGYPWIESAVRVNGDVVSCCQRQHIMGNILRDDFMTIWNNKAYRTLRLQKSYYRCMGINCNMAEYSIWNGAVTRGNPCGGDSGFILSLRRSLAQLFRRLHWGVPAALSRFFR